MSQYSKAQENRMEQKLQAIGFSTVEKTGRLRTHAGDRVMRHDDTGVVLSVDHKSTIGKEYIQFKRAWLDKIKEEAVANSVPCITFSFKGCHRVYIAFDIDDLEGVMY